MKYFCLIPLYFFCISSYSQEKTVVIKDSLTLKPVPFAIVKIVNEERGFYSDFNGKVTLTNSTDSILVRCVGYKKKMVSLTEIDDKIFLVPEVIKLEEFKITSDKKVNFKKLGFFKKTNQSAGFFPGSEICVYIKNDFPSDLLFIQRVFFLAKNFDSGKSFYRIHFYYVNENGPGKEIISANKVYTTSKKREQIVDVSAQRIIIPPEGIFVSIEIIGGGTTKDPITVDPRIFLTTKYPEQNTYYRGRLLGHDWETFDLLPFPGNNKITNAVIYLEAAP